MHWELWDVETRNVLEDFGTEVEALAAARELIELNRPAYPAALALARWNDDGSTTWLAQGERLADLVRSSGTGRALSA